MAFLSNVSNCQESKDFFIDEFQLSVNRTNLKDNNTEDRYGFGLGAYHSFMSDKKINLVIGFEYNKTSQFKRRMYEGKFAHTTDLTYNLNCLSVPVGFRFNIGSKTKIFIETGGFADLMINSNRKGTLHNYHPDENNQINYSEKEIDEKAKLSSAVGIYVGLGVRIPISKFELIIKPDYKLALNKLYSYQDDIYNRYFRMNIGLRF